MADIDISGSLPSLPEGVISGGELTGPFTVSSAQLRSTHIIPSVPEGASKVTVEFKGTSEGSGAAHWAPEPPTPYEARRDALSAAATYCSAGGWGEPAAVIGVAREFEKYLKEAL